MVTFFVLVWLDIMVRRGGGGKKGGSGNRRKMFGGSLVVSLGIAESARTRARTGKCGGLFGWFFGGWWWDTQFWCSLYVNCKYLLIFYLGVVVW